MSGSASRNMATMFQMMSLMIEQEKDHLSELDGAIGDGDHGITMSIGFIAINTALSKLDLDQASLSDIMSTAANGFLNAVGASTGPLYATGFQRAAHVLSTRETLDWAGCADVIGAIASGIRERGKAQRGDKTMLDVWLPAADAATNALSEGKTEAAFWEDIVVAADNAAEATRSMIATKGRAARLRERSLGHPDPGAVSAALLIKVMAGVWRTDQV